MSQLLAGLAVVADLRGEDPPDKDWFRQYFLLTGDHMVLTEEGWIPAACNTKAFTGFDPAEVLEEVNAPREASAAFGGE